jgi:hypothetical protein
LTSPVKAVYGQSLGDLELPSGFSWLEANVSVGDADALPKSFEAVYNPDPANYLDFPVTFLVSVEKRPVTIKAIDKVKYLGQGDPSFDVSVVEGSLAPGDSIDASLHYNGSRVGEYDITPSEPVVNDNYEITFLKGVMSVRETVLMQVVTGMVTELPRRVDTPESSSLVASAYTAYGQLSKEEILNLDNNVPIALQDAIMKAKAFNHSSGVVRLSYDNLPWYVRLEATAIPSEDEFSLSYDAALRDKKLYRIYRLDLLDTRTGDRYLIEEGRTFNVTVSGIELKNSDNIQVTRIVDGNEASTTIGSCKNGELTFETRIAGDYAVTLAGSQYPVLMSNPIGSSGNEKVDWVPFASIGLVASIFLLIVKLQEMQESRYTHSGRRRAAYAHASRRRSKAGASQYEEKHVNSSEDSQDNDP